MTNKICVWLLFKIALGRKSGRARFRKIASCRYDLGTSDKEIYGLKYQVPEHLISCECRSLNSRSTLWQKCSWFIEKANDIFLTSLFIGDLNCINLAKTDLQINMSLLYANVCHMKLFL